MSIGTTRGGWTGKMGPMPPRQSSRSVRGNRCGVSPPSAAAPAASKGCSTPAPSSLDEVGYEALSTTRIAERAGVAIGSVYQFFPDKRAITQALTRRNVEQFVSGSGAASCGRTTRGWWDAVDAIIDEYVDMHRTVPGFRTLHFGDVVDLNLLDAEWPTTTR